MKKIKEISIDQISLMVPINSQTLSEFEIPEEVQMVRYLFKFDDIFDKPEELNHGFNGYTNALKYGTSQAKVLIMWSWRQPWMGVFVMFYGQGKKLYESLANLINFKVDWKKIIEEIYFEFAGHVSRLDTAVDLINYGFSVNLISQKLNNGKYLFLNGKTKRQIGTDRIQTIGDSGVVDTIYVGKRKSDAYLRIYNKRKEGISNKNNGYYYQAKATTDWIRIEAEIKGRTAHQLGDAIARLNDARKMYPLLAENIMDHWMLVKNDEEKEL